MSRALHLHPGGLCWSSPIALLLDKAIVIDSSIVKSPHSGLASGYLSGFRGERSGTQVAPFKPSVLSSHVGYVVRVLLHLLQTGLARAIDNVCYFPFSGFRAQNQLQSSCLFSQLSLWSARDGMFSSRSTGRHFI